MIFIFLLKSENSIKRQVKNDDFGYQKESKGEFLCFTT